MTQLHGRTRNAAFVGAAVVAAAITGTAAAAATPLSGMVDGPVSSVNGSSFTLTTSLSPSGRSTVELSSTTKTTAQQTGKRSNLKHGVCLLVMGTSGGASIAATQIVIRSCNSAGRATGAGRTGGGSPGGGQGLIGVSRPANFALAVGTVKSISGSTLVVNGKSGSTSVKLSSSTKVERTVTVKASAIKVDECALVRGTSTDDGVTVKAETVSLTPALKSGCTSPFGHA